MKVRVVLGFLQRYITYSLCINTRILFALPFDLILRVLFSGKRALEEEAGGD